MFPNVLEDSSDVFLVTHLIESVSVNIESKLLYCPNLVGILTSADICFFINKMSFI